MQLYCCKQKNASVTACYEKRPVDEKIIAYKDDCLASGSSHRERRARLSAERFFFKGAEPMGMLCSVFSWHFEIEVFKKGNF